MPERTRQVLFVALRGLMEVARCTGLRFVISVDPTSVEITSMRPTGDTTTALANDAAGDPAELRRICEHMVDPALDSSLFGGMARNLVAWFRVIRDPHAPHIRNRDVIVSVHPDSAALAKKHFEHFGASGLTYCGDTCVPSGEVRISIDPLVMEISGPNFPPDPLTFREQHHG